MTMCNVFGDYKGGPLVQERKNKYGLEAEIIHSQWETAHIF